MNLKQLVLIATGIFAIAGTAEARQYTLDYRDTQFTSGTTVFLKRDLERAYPRVNFRNAELRDVSVEIKSSRGRGDASLLINSREVDRRGVYSDPREWNNPAAYTYDNLRLLPRLTNPRDNWDVRLSGDVFKVRRITVEVVEGRQPVPPGPGPRPPRPPSDRYTDVACESYGQSSAFCRIGFQVTHAELRHDYPGSTGCREGRNWFASPQGIEVRDGCRGLFRVYGR